MDLNSLREQIDRTDDEILRLFIHRMELCRGVADYKRENHLPVLQGGREKEILDRIRGLCPEGLENGGATLFSNIMDISKCLQQRELRGGDNSLSPAPFCPETAKSVACQGVSGANSEAAARKLFGDAPIKFYHEFEDVFKAVESGEAEFGILPIQNSTAGSVTQTYELMAQYDFYVTAMVPVEITHVLAAHPELPTKEIKNVYSHPQALSQCSRYIKAEGLTPVPYENTAAAARYILENRNGAAICSRECAELYGLRIISDRITNAYPNITKFICISKEFLAAKDASAIAVALRLQNTKGSLYRLLTKFMVSGLNLERIESKTIAGENFEVMFYLDFSGKVEDENVKALIFELGEELSYFKFLGNYKEIT